MELRCGGGERRGVGGWAFVVIVAEKSDHLALRRRSGLLLSRSPLTQEFSPAMPSLLFDTP